MLRLGRGSAVVLLLAVLSAASSAFASRDATKSERGPRALQPWTLAGASEPTGASVECLGRRVTILGTNLSDVLEGTAGADVIAGLGGDDTIRGRDGNDLVCPGPGDDRVDGGRGLDNVEASDGDDILDGGPGADFVRFDLAPAPVTVHLALGTATGWGTDVVLGFRGVVGSRFGDRISATRQRDQLEGKAGDDVLLGRNGLDLLMPGTGKDTVLGGRGFDYVAYWESPNPIRASLRSGSAAGAGPDRFASIEGLAGSGHPDVLVGDKRRNGLYGYGGHDVLRGLSGDDWLHGGEGPDVLDGGRGRDLLFGGPGWDVCIRGERKRSCP